jgi:hypothetical protein
MLYYIILRCSEDFFYVCPMGETVALRGHRLDETEPGKVFKVSIHCVDSGLTTKGSTVLSSSLAGLLKVACVHVAHVSRQNIELLIRQGQPFGHPTNTRNS